MILHQLICRGVANFGTRCIKKTCSMWGRFWLDRTEAILAGGHFNWTPTEIYTVKLLSNNCNHQWFDSQFLASALCAHNCHSGQESELSFYAVFWCQELWSPVTINQSADISFYDCLFDEWIESLAVDIRLVTNDHAFEPQPPRCRVSTLGKLFTPMCLCYQTV